MVKKAKSIGRPIHERIYAVKQFIASNAPRTFSEIGRGKINQIAVLDKDRKGRKVTITNKKNTQKVKEILESKPTSPIRTVATEVGISVSSTERMKLSLGLKSYRMQRRQELKDTDYKVRKDACEKLLNKQKKCKSFRDWIYFSDECIFELAGHVNTYNCYFHASMNPHFTMEVSHKSGSLMVWCAISSFGLIGPIFLLETVTQQVYQDMIGNQFVPDLHARHSSLDRVFFQQDGAPAHTAKTTQDFLHDQFENRLIGKFLDFNWPHRIPDLTPPDFFLWGYLKDRVYEPQPQTLVDLKFDIIRECEALSVDTCKSVCSPLCGSDRKYQIFFSKKLPYIQMIQPDNQSDIIDYSEVLETLRIPLTGSIMQMKIIWEQQQIVCQKLIARFKDKEDDEGRSNAINAGITVELAKIYESRDLSSISLPFIEAFYCISFPGVHYDFNTKIYQKCNPFPGMFRLLELQNFEMLRIVIKIICGLIGGGEWSDNLEHPYFQSIISINGGNKLFSLFQRNDVDNKIRNVAAISLGRLFKAQELPRNMKQSIIDHLKSITSDADEWTRFLSRRAINILAQNEDNRTEIMKVFDPFIVSQDLRLPIVGNEETRKQIQQKKNFHCILLQEMFEKAEDNLLKRLVGTGIIEAFLYFFETQDLNMLTRDPVENFRRLRSFSKSQIDQIKKEKRYYPSIIRLFGSQYPEVIYEANLLIYSDFDTGADLAKDNQPNLLFEEISECGGIEILFDLFQRNLDKDSRNYAAKLLVVLFVNQEFPNAQLRKEIIEYWITPLINSNSDEQKTHIWSLNRLAMVVGNHAEILKGNFIAKALQALPEKAQQFITKIQLQTSNLANPKSGVKPKQQQQQQSSSSSSSQQTSAFNTTWKLSDFIKIKKIGRGRFGTVSSYQEIKTQRIVAIKECDYDTDELRSMMNREIEVMKDIIRIIRQSTHQSQFIHVVEPLGFFVNEDEEKAYLVMELCSGGDLRSYIKNMRKQGTEIGAKKCWEFVSSIITAVNQLHVNDIIHGDLKPENVLLTEDIKVKLADFGLSRKLQQGKEYMTHHGGTTFYLPPELLQIQSVQTDAEGRQLHQKRQQTKAADIWAIGIMLYELLAQHHPFIGNDDADLSELEVAHRIVTEEPSELPAHYPDSLRKLIKAMLSKAFD
ncbi:MAG: putative transposable element tc3 transposase [Streblomastix strix]|uniref:Putative transposable element tc3 transposase n=1 Tax=Streblomastix strix TaxID=222440 RepID=A0A5J4WFY7_9EUKA|nr:MAG: putative transposable element tc3 transposase [Streblomastix strix]